MQGGWEPLLKGLLIAALIVSTTIGSVFAYKFLFRNDNFDLTEVARVIYFGVRDRIDPAGKKKREADERAAELKELLALCENDIMPTDIGGQICMRKLLEQGYTLHSNVIQVPELPGEEEGPDGGFFLEYLHKNGNLFMCAGSGLDRRLGLARCTLMKLGGA